MAVILKMKKIASESAEIVVCNTVIVSSKILSNCRILNV